MRAQCGIPECGKTVAARGWCKRHWQRWRKTGDPTGFLRLPLGVVPLDGEQWRDVPDFVGLYRVSNWEALRDGPPRTVAELVRATGIEDAIVCRLLIRLVETDRATVVGSPARWTLTAQERRRVRGG